MFPCGFIVILYVIGFQSGRMMEVSICTKMYKMYKMNFAVGNL